MFRPLRHATLFLLTGAAITGGFQPAMAEIAAADAQSTAIVAAASAFLDTLDNEQQGAVLFDFNDATQRVHWSNFPTGGPGADRAGIRWGELNDPQRAALTAMLGAVLSPTGLRMVQEQMAADDVVLANDAKEPPVPDAAASPDAAAAPDAGTAPDAATGPDAAAAPPTDGGPANGPGNGRPPVHFGKDYYFVSFLGTPSTSGPWMLQFGGHHLAINATVVGPDVTLSPTLSGGQPLKFDMDGRSVYIVGDEVARATALLAGLTDAQRAKAVVSADRVELVLGPGKDGMVLQPEGLPGAQMTADQKAQLLALINARVGMLNADDAAARLAEIAATLDQTSFGWWGPVDPVGAGYFRITGPNVLIEYSPETQDGDPTDHAHSMYRDPTNEYGAGWVALP